MTDTALPSPSRVRRMRCQVAIVGGGPVGLFLGCCLRKLGLDFLILERSLRREARSRAIGIHPPSLELLEQLGLADRFVKDGIQIRRARAIVDRKEAASLSFESCPGPFRFVLSLPQDKTESILEEGLGPDAASHFQRGASVLNVREQDTGVELRAQDAAGEPFAVDCGFAVGCDGRSSLVRGAAGIAFAGRAYPDTYVMADVVDDTDLGPEAYLFLGTYPLVESFPLPPNLRRWVLKTPGGEPPTGADRFSNEIRARTGYDLNRKEMFHLSAFGIERALASSFYRGRVALAGDAAHVMSPMGGQGMNVGWMDAWDLARALFAVFREGRVPERALAAYSRRGRRRARRASRRAAFNTVLGRRARLPLLRRRYIRCFLSAPVSPWSARFFTMRWLGPLAEFPESRRPVAQLRTPNP